MAFWNNSDFIFTLSVIFPLLLTILLIILLIFKNPLKIDAQTNPIHEIIPENENEIPQANELRQRIGKKKQQKLQRKIQTRNYREYLQTTKAQEEERMLIIEEERQQRNAAASKKREREFKRMNAQRDRQRALEHETFLQNQILKEIHQKELACKISNIKLYIQKHQCVSFQDLKKIFQSSDLSEFEEILKQIEEIEEMVVNRMNGSILYLQHHQLLELCELIDQKGRISKNEISEACLDILKRDKIIQSVQ